MRGQSPSSRSAERETLSHQKQIRRGAKISTVCCFRVGNPIKGFPVARRKERCARKFLRCSVILILREHGVYLVIRKTLTRKCSFHLVDPVLLRQLSGVFLCNKL